ncbi:MAG: hypothetical protein WCG27_13015 [Pseudomonadota bacterium]
MRRDIRPISRGGHDLDSRTISVVVVAVECKLKERQVSDKMMVVPFKKFCVYESLV